MSCRTGSQVTFISEDETPLAQTLVGATLGSGDRHRMGLDSQALPVPYRAAANWDCPLLGFYRAQGSGCRASPRAHFSFQRASLL